MRSWGYMHGTSLYQNKRIHFSHWQWAWALVTPLIGLFPGLYQIRFSSDIIRNRPHSPWQDCAVQTSNLCARTEARRHGHGVVIGYRATLVVHHRTQSFVPPLRRLERGQIQAHDKRGHLGIYVSYCSLLNVCWHFLSFLSLTYIQIPKQNCMQHPSKA